MSVAALPSSHPIARSFRVLGAAIHYELRKATAFRAGFVIREVLRGAEKPAVMIAVYWAMLRGGGTFGGYTFRDLVSYLILVAVFEKLVVHERLIDVAEQIFEGYLTKFMIMPVRYYLLVAGRFVQHVAVQFGVAVLFFTVGAITLPEYWPHPVSALAALEALTLVVLGSYCLFVLFFIINCLAFWLDVIWTLLVMTMFITGFLRGILFPIATMPAAAQTVLHASFPYWTLSGPIEIFVGRLGHEAFARGLVVLLSSALALEALRVFVWRRGLRNYAGAGM